MAREVLIGQTDYSVLIFIPDSASTDGSGKTGLVAANLTAGYTRVETDNDVVHTDGTSSLNNLAALTTAHTDWGILEVSSTLAPGLYRLDLPDAIFATGAWSAVVYVMVTTSAAAATPIEFVMIGYDKQLVTWSATRGLAGTALPAAAANAPNGLPVSIAGGLDLDAKIGALTYTVANKVDANISTVVGVTPTVGASLDFPTQIASRTNITGGTITTVTNLTNAPTAGDLTATMKASVNAEADTAIADAALATAANLATVDTVVDAILVDTAEIGTAGAGLTALATQASVNTIDDFLDTEVAAILAAVDTEVGAIKTKTDSLTFTVANQIDANVLALNGVTASAANLEKSAAVIQRGTVDAGSFSTTTTEFESDDVATAAADHWIGRIVIFTSGTLALQATTITDYAKVGSNGHFTVDALTSIPADNVTFVLI